MFRACNVRAVLSVWGGRRRASPARDRVPSRGWRGGALLCCTCVVLVYLEVDTKTRLEGRAEMGIGYGLVVWLAVHHARTPSHVTLHGTTDETSGRTLAHSITKNQGRTIHMYKFSFSLLLTCYAISCCCVHWGFSSQAKHPHYRSTPCTTCTSPLIGSKEESPIHGIIRKRPFQYLTDQPLLNQSQ